MSQQDHNFPAHLASSPANPALLQEAVIVTHDQLRFDHLDSIHCHTDDNQQRRTAEVEVDSKPLRDPLGQKRIETAANERDVLDVEARDHELWNDRNEREVKAANESDSGQDRVDVFGSSLTRPDTRNESAILSHVVRRFVGVEDDRRIEVGEEYDAEDVQQVVERFAESKRIGDAGKNTAKARGVIPYGQAERLRERQYRGRKDDRYHTAGVYAERKMRRLTAQHAPSDHALRVLDRYSPLATFHQNNKSNHCDHHGDQNQQREDRPFIGADLLVDVAAGFEQPHNDTGKDDQLHTVADAPVGNLFAQPHDERRSGSQGQHRHQYETDARIYDNSLPLERDRNACRLHGAEHDGEVACVRCDLAASEFAFLGKLLQIGPYDCQQLENDRCRDVRHDT